MRDILNLRIKIRPRFFGTEDFSNLEKRIKQVLEQGSVAICVFDVDTVGNNPKEKIKYEEFKKKYIEKKDVILCDSLPSLEYWFLIHYEDTNRYFNNSDSVIQSLKSYIPEYEKGQDFLQNQKWVADMVTGNKLDTAISRAKQYSTKEGSYSNVFKAMEFMMP